MADFIIGGIVFGWVGLLIWMMIRKKRKGESIACSGCAHAQQCNTIKKEKC